MKINIREKKVLLVTIGAASILLAYFYIVEPLIASQQSISAELANSVNTLKQNQLKVSRQQKLKQKLERLKQEFNQLEAGLLPGNKAPIAAAELQKIIKKIVTRQGVSIISEKVLKPVDMGIYQRIAVQVTVRCLTSKLKKIIYQIENHEIMLNIPQISIKLVNTRHPKDVQAMMLVEGAIKAGEG
jgi:general secretion pathway protein M